jgi:HPt (histidine-containing phosphotransfer) domain-containing protein
MGRNAASKAHYQQPPDFAWLQERCDGDNQLVLEVLRCFCEQGQTHIQALQSAMKERDKTKLVFHAVKIMKLPI